MSFQGFPVKALKFLRELRDHNDRAWFEENRATYEEALLEPAREFVVAAGEALVEAGMEVHAVPKVGGSIMRINRDTRFSKDKRPYKDHLDMMFWHGEGPSRSRPGYWFRLTPEVLMLGGGKHDFGAELLPRYRDQVVDEGRGAALEAAIAAVRAGGMEGVAGERFRRVPAGYPADHPRAWLLKYDGLYTALELPPPPQLHGAELPAFCVMHWRRVAPLVDWLAEL